jgi:hypothetical protein
VHVDLAEVWTQAGKLYLFVAIDRVSKFAFAELHERATRRIAAEFLRRLIDCVPFRIHTVLTDNGFQFTPPRGGWSVGEIQQLLANHQPFRAHAFDLACAQHAIEHRLTKFNHPWTNGQVERMNRTIKDATVRRFYYETHDSLRAHLTTFLEAYNFATRLKSLRGLTPFERICQLWTEQPERFRLNPFHHTPGMNSYDTHGFVETLRTLEATPHIAQKRNSRTLDARTTRHPGYAISQRTRKRIEEVFGWMKTVGGLRKLRHRGGGRVNWQFLLAAAAYNLVRMRTLEATT